MWKSRGLDMAQKKKDANKYKELFRQVSKVAKQVAEEDCTLSDYYVGREKYLDKKH